MSLSYCENLPGETPALPARVLSFYRWLCRWHADTADLHASTRYYARKQGVTERTVYRWLAALRKVGWISCDTTPGIERRITPQAPAPPAPTRHKKALRRTKMSGVCQGSMSGVIPYRVSSDAGDASTRTCESVPAALSEQVSAVADELTAAGVPARVALQLAAAHGVKAVRQALQAYRNSKNIRNAAGWLIRAVERKYQYVPQDAPTGRQKARRAVVVVPDVPAINGATGKAAFDSLRSKVRLGGAA